MNKFHTLFTLVLCLLAQTAHAANLRGVAAPNAGVNRRLDFLHLLSGELQEDDLVSTFGYKIISAQDFSVMSDATKAFTGFLKERLDTFLQDVKDVETGVKQWKAEWESLGLVKMPEFHSAVAVAQKTLVNANFKGKTAVETMQTKLDFVLNNVKAAFDGNDKNTKQEAIIMARMTLTALFKTTASSVKELSEDIEKAEKDFIAVKTKADTYQGLIDDSIAGKTDEMEHHKAEWRGAAYGTATAGVAACAAASMGAGVPFCAPALYATALGIVESKIAEANENLRKNKENVQRLADNFERLGAQAAALAKEADTMFKNFYLAAKNAGDIGDWTTGDDLARAKAWQAPGTQIRGREAKREAKKIAVRIFRHWEVNVIPSMKTLQTRLKAITDQWAQEAAAVKAKALAKAKAIEEEKSPTPFWSSCYSNESCTFGDRDTCIRRECQNKGLKYYEDFQDCGGWKFKGYCK